MKSHLILLVLVGLTYASNNPAWEYGKEYTYQVTGLSLTNLHEVSDWYSGILLNVSLYITPLDNGNLYAKIMDARYSELHTKLPNDWNSDFTKLKLDLQPLPLSSNTFQIVMRDGLITNLTVDAKMPSWEINVRKAIMSQFQLDVKGKNQINMPASIVPDEGRFNGLFKTMEETITGETETTYHIQRFPEYLAQLQPWLVPKPNSKYDVITEISKSKEFTNSRQTPAYHFGFDGITEGYPTFNRAGTFFSRNSNCRLIVTGNYSMFTVQSITSMNKIIINPTLDAKEQGSIVGFFNITLTNVRSTDPPARVDNLIDVGNLIYKFYAKPPFIETERQMHTHDSSEESSESFDNGLRRARKRMVSLLDKDFNCSLVEEMPNMLPHFTEYNGKPLNSGQLKDIIGLAKKIGKEMQEPETILVNSTLGTYVLLSSLVRLMNESDIDKASEELFPDSDKGEAYVSWVAFRSAVAGAGTINSLSQIYEWIKTEKYQEHEAYEIVAAMSHATKFLTKEYMDKFFEMIKDPAVCGQKWIKETSLLVFTRLVNKVYVNRNVSYNEYSIHSFENVNTSERIDKFVSDVILYLKTKLDEAIKQANNRLIHVYIRALGNVGHKKILKVFKPYLERTKQVSQFQRMLMVLNMDKLVESESTYSRSVLYDLYKNTAELPEIRVVAIAHLLKTNPPAEMLQRMAENTNIDPQEDVNAAIKSAIENLSSFKSPEQLRTAARSAKPLLTTKNYGAKHSFMFLRQFITENMDIELTHNFLQVSSTDNSLPKGVKFEAHKNMNGMKDFIFNIHAMVSSVKELSRVFYQETALFTSPHYSDTIKIAKDLKLQISEREQLEGFIYAQIEYIDRLWSVNNYTIAELPERIRQMENELSQGKPLLYTKLQKLKEISLSLPTELGFPMWYTYDLPMFVQVKGNITANAQPPIVSEGKIQKPEKITARIISIVTVSSKVQSYLKMVTPFDQSVFTAGFDKNIQAHIPIKATVEVNVENYRANIGFEVMEIDKDDRLLHYSSWPYTSVSDVRDLHPIQLDKNKCIINPGDHRLFDNNWGQNQTGINFRVWGHQPILTKSLLENLALLKSRDISTIWQQIWDEASLQQSEISLGLTSDHTSTQKVTVVLRSQGNYVQSPKDQNQKPFQTIKKWFAEVPEESEQRQAYMMDFVGAGITSAKINFFDASFEFDGDQKYEHSYTVAFGKSNVHSASRFVALYRGLTKQTTSSVIDVIGNIPNTNELDYSYSENHEPKASYKLQYQHQNQNEPTAEINSDMEFSRSEERKQYLSKQPLYSHCMHQMEEGNGQLSACHNMTIESKYFDSVTMNIELRHLTQAWKRSLATTYNTLRLLFLFKTNITEFTEEQNKINITVRYEPKTLRFVNVTVMDKKEGTKYINFTMSETVKAILVSNPLYDVNTRFVGQVRGHKNIRPTCVVDKVAAQTFSDLIYPVSSLKDWTIMLLYVPQVARSDQLDPRNIVDVLKNQQEYYTVMVRELGNKRKEVKLIYNNLQTYFSDVVFSLKPENQGMPSVWVNDARINFTHEQAANLYNNSVEIYALPNNEVKMDFKDDFYIVYDGDRVMISATSKLRDSIVGLCGRFSEDKYEDFTTPANCVVNSAESFIQSYLLTKDFYGNHRNQRVLENETCVPKVLPIPTKIIPDDSDERTDESRPVKLITAYLIDSSKNEICFTTHPLPNCDDRTIRTYVIKEVPVHCLLMTKTAMYIKKQIDAGGNPGLSHMSVTKIIKMEIPKTCV